MTIEQAHTPDQYADARMLIEAYQAWSGFDLSYKGFGEELETLPEMYGPPVGSLLIAYEGDVPVGVVGLRKFESGICEMKRMFVLPDWQGRGIGKALLAGFLDRAVGLAYRVVRLDTLRSFRTAIGLYEAVGFREIPPYRFNPDPDVVYLELVLSERR